jgi:pyruvate,water dikinase
MSQPNIVWFSQIGKEDIPLVGGKGANLGEMTRIGMPVPNGYVVTAPAFYAFLDATGLRPKIRELLEKLNTDDTKKLQETALAVQALVKKAKMPEDIAKDIAKAYHQLSSKDVYVAVRSSATAEDLPDASFAGQQATFLNVIGAEQVIHAVQSAWASLFEARAIFYRVEQKFDHFKVGIAVPVQRMVEAEVAGIMFSLDPITNNTNIVTIEAVWGLGETIVSGAITPDHYEVDKQTWQIIKKEVVKQEWQLVRSAKKDNKSLHEANHKLPVSVGWQRKQKLEDDKIIELAKLSVKLEQHYKHEQDSEWAYADHTVYLVQTRPVTTIKTQAPETPMTVEVAASTAAAPNKPPILSGAPGSPGVAHGPVRVIHSPEEIDKIKKGDVLVTEMTTPDYVPGMKRASAIVTDEGGRTAHAAIVSRELGIPAIVGTGEATKMLKTGEIITVDGSNGKVYEGEVAIAKPTTTPTGMPTLMGTGAPPANLSQKTATKVYVNLGEPELAEEIAKKNVDGIGLLRAEFMIANIGEHPRYMIERGKQQVFVDKLYEGLMTFAKAFDPRPVIYRATDFKTNEYKHLHGGEKFEQDEDNPMIGYRGAFRYVTDPEVFKLEIQAVRRVRQYHKNLWMMIPFVRTPQELVQTKQIMAEEGLYRGGSFKLFMMAEIPANVILLDQFIGVGIDGISIGSNDLTQLVLGLDRDNAKVAVEFDERNEAVMWALEQLVKGAARHGIMCSICGQAPSVYPEITRKLVEWGATSVSVSPDMIAQTRQIVAEAEYDLVRLGKTIKAPKA